MSHNVEYHTYPENCDKSKVENEINKYVSHCTYAEGGGGLPSAIRWNDNKIYANRDEAEEAISKMDDGWYNQIAVKFKELPRDVTSAKFESLYNKKVEVVKKARTLNSEVQVKSMKSQYVSCKKCGSKLNKDFLKTNYCPLCQNDMRSDTIKNKLDTYKVKLIDLDKQLSEEYKRLTEKKGEVKWLVKIEYHT